MSFGHLCIDWPFGAVYLIAPAIAADLGLSAPQVGLLLTMQSLGGAIAYLPAGILADRVSDRGRWIAVTFFWVVMGYLFASMSEGFWFLGLMMAIACMGDAAWHPMATGILTRAAPNARARVLGIHAIGGTLSGVAAPLVAGYTLTFFDWRTALQISVAPTLVMGLLFLFFIARMVPKVEARSGAALDLKGIAKDWFSRRGVMLMVTMVLYNLAMTGAVAMTPLFLRQTKGLDIWDTSLIYSGTILVGALSQPMVGKISDVVGRYPVVVVGCSIAAGGAFLVVVADDLIATIIGLTMIIAALEGIRSAVLASAVDLSGRSEGTTLGTAFIILDGVGALGAFLAGWAGAIDLTHAFVLVGVLAVGSAVLTMISRAVLK